MTVICTRMAIFGIFWPFSLLEPFSLYLSVLSVQWKRLFYPFEKKGKGLLPKNHQNGHFKCYSSHFWPFFQVLPDDHLDTHFSNQ